MQSEEIKLCWMIDQHNRSRMTCCKSHTLLASLATALALLLSACGGGGADTNSNPNSGSAGSTTLTTAPTAVTSTSSSTTPTGINNPSTPSTSTAAQSCNLPNFSQNLLARINAERAAGATCGGQVKPAVSALSWSTTLTQAADLHSQDMIARNFFSHTNPSGQSVGERVSAQGYTWRAVGENIAAGQRSIDEVMNAWMSSSGHCNNIMSGNYSEVGVACVLNASDPKNYAYYWTMVLARPR